MVDILHKELPIEKSHSIHKWEFASVDAMISYGTSLNSDKQGCVARVNMSGDILYFAWVEGTQWELISGYEGEEGGEGGEG